MGFALVLWLFVPAHAEEPEGAATLLRAVNALRAEHHLRALEPKKELSEVAQSHADDMAQRHYLSHINPEGLNPLDRTRAAGVEGFRLLAENIGVTSRRGEPQRAILSEWLASPIHRANLLHPAFNSTGLGITRDAENRTITVQLYAAY
jgi:uncharacterized protein YkwD